MWGGLACDKQVSLNVALSMKNTQIVAVPRHRSHLKRPKWIIIMVSLFSFFVVCAFVYPPQNSGTACSLFSSHGCKTFQKWIPPTPVRELTDDELAAHVVIKEILDMPINISTTPKIAFLFLTPGALPFEKLWDRFFQVIPFSVSIFSPFPHIAITDTARAN